MGEIISISVDEELVNFVNALVDDGRYASASEVISEALLLLKKEEEAAVAAIRAAIEEGEASGEAQPFDFAQFLAEMHRKHGK